jgi:hypothetical protein
MAKMNLSEERKEGPLLSSTDSSADRATCAGATGRNKVDEQKEEEDIGRRRRKRRRRRRRRKQQQQGITQNKRRDGRRGSETRFMNVRGSTANTHQLRLQGNAVVG